VEVKEKVRVGAVACPPTPNVGHREGSRLVKRILSNLSGWPAHKVELLRRLLRDEPLTSPCALFSVVESWPSGHVEVDLELVRQVGIDRLIASKPSRVRFLILEMIVERVLRSSSQLATTRLWKTISPARELALEHADMEELCRESGLAAPASSQRGAELCSSGIRA
jgi:hypothetical protein